MQNTTNLGLKKPDYTDFADIQDINDNMDTLDAAIHDTQNSVATFTSSDVADGSATSWTTVTKVSSGETHKSIFAKMSQMFKNIRYLYKMLGTTDISSIGNGTVTGGLSSLNDSLTKIATFEPGTDPAVWTGNYTNSFSVSLSRYRMLIVFAEYNGQIMDSIMGPLSMFSNKPIYLGWNDGTLNARAKITIATNYESATVSSYTGFTKVILFGVR